MVVNTTISRLRSDSLYSHKNVKLILHRPTGILIIKRNALCPWLHVH